MPRAANAPRSTFPGDRGCHDPATGALTGASTRALAQPRAALARIREHAERALRADAADRLWFADTDRARDLVAESRSWEWRDE